MSNLFPIVVDDLVETLEVLQGQAGEWLLVFRMLVQCLENAHHLPLG